MKIYKILPNRYYGGEIEVPDGTMGIPKGTTRTAPPVIPPGMTAIWNGRGWDIARYPAPAAPVNVVETPGFVDETLNETNENSQTQ